MLEDDDSLPGLRETEKEAIRKLMELLEELSETINPPIDPRVAGLLLIAADLLNQQLEMDISYNNEEETDDDMALISERGPLELTEEEASALVKEIMEPKSNMDFSKVQQNMLFLIDEPDIEPPSLPGKTLGDQMADDINAWFDELDANNGAF